MSDEQDHFDELDFLVGGAQPRQPPLAYRSAILRLVARFSAPSCCLDGSTGRFESPLRPSFLAASACAAGRPSVGFRLRSTRHGRTAQKRSRLGDLGLPALFFPEQKVAFLPSHSLENGYAEQLKRIGQNDRNGIDELQPR